MKTFSAFISELSVPLGATGNRTNVKVDYQTIRDASGKLVKRVAGKSGSSGGGGGGGSGSGGE